MAELSHLGVAFTLSVLLRARTWSTTPAPRNHRVVVEPPPSVSSTPYPIVTWVLTASALAILVFRNNVVLSLHSNIGIILSNKFLIAEQGKEFLSEHLFGWHHHRYQAFRSLSFDPSIDLQKLILGLMSLQVTMIVDTLNKSTFANREVRGCFLRIIPVRSYKYWFVMTNSIGGARRQRRWVPQVIVMDDESSNEK
ncbi:hypothetical protein C4D60_Mb10t27890 [Musa balbisiana]|uniref:Uncharacterized protein n=1 Tax=Musa balbisiana TaxID=52838 RepID=A0A4S8J082_MUSBA|nr:hypothetical protein C4D60_Mb10t27890 [Musa balbisiana]